MVQDQSITLRIAKAAEINNRADKLVKLVSKAPEYRAVRISRSAVLRLALLEGLAILEDRYRGAGSAPGKHS
ncbi:MAG: hypothetical protein M0R80_22340 [Proteobacteria bacterium]|jgi:hypothetical protein|nr:hypothetical protein [Pseudomonadota bacterium]